jgi:predicted amidophosphoribosyltransferase
MEKTFTRSDGNQLEILYPPYCEVCGNPIPESFADTFPFCGACKGDPDKHTPIVRARAFGKYYYEDEKPHDLLSNEIRRLKKDVRHVHLLQECLYYSIDSQYPELTHLEIIVPIMRGSDDEEHNQAALLAQGIASRYSKPYLDILFKKEPYRSMHTIHSNIEKEREIAGKIGCNYQFNGESILLIDDTYIFGTTKRECGKVLKEHGAGEIWSLVLGRMVNKEHMDALRRYNG